MSARTVLFVESGTSGGGSFVSLVQLLANMDRSRFRPVVVFLNRTGFLEEVREMGVDAYLLHDRVYTKTVPWFVQKRLERLVKGVFRRAPLLAPAVFALCHGPLMRRLREIIRGQQVELLYLNDQIDRDLFGVFVARDAGLPLVSHLRSMNGENMIPAKADFANRHVAVYIANSGVTRDYWVERGIDADKCRVIHNAVPFEPVEPLDLRGEYGIPGEHRLLGCVARLVHVKGHDFLLEAFADLLGRRPNTTLLLAGQGPLEADLRALAARLGISERVVFAGHVNPVRPFMAGLDALALASKNDAFGRTLAEGMQLGLPVVGVDRGGIPEVIAQDGDGLLVPHGDVQAMSAALERALFDEDLGQRLRRSGPRSAARRFDPAGQARRIEDVLDAALGR